MKQNKEIKLDHQPTADVEARETGQTEEADGSSSHQTIESQGAAGQNDPDRGQWGSPAEFLLSCIGFAVGFGNIWRFPYLCYVNGGGAFLIPYIIMLVFVGLPTFLIELAVGQYCAGGPMEVWSVSPLFKGIGAGMIMITFMSNINYNMLLGWSIWFMALSWQKTLPWSVCTHSYNTEYCYTKHEANSCETSGNGSGIWFNMTCYNESYIGKFDTYYGNCDDLILPIPPHENGTMDESNCTIINTLRDFLTDAVTRRVGASEEFYDLKILERSASIEEPGKMKWDACVALLGAWVLCIFCVIKGIKSAGKVVYFTAIFPYIILIILLIRGVLLPGASKGIEFYLIPEWSKLASPKVWADAAGQVFFSLSVGMGGLMTFASYNKFNNNIYRDTIIVVLLDAFTSFFAGFAIFSILGYLAHTLGREVSDVATSGSGLAFIAYPEVVTFLEPPQLWSTLFFFMLITLGIDSQFAGIETMLTTMVDWYPKLRTPVNKAITATVMCIGMFICGLSMCTQAGVYWLELMSYYSNGWSLVLIGLAESIVFPWVYGADRLLDDIEAMVGFRLWKHWWFCWKFITPVLLIAIMVFNMYENTPLSYGDYLLPDWSQALGWLMAVSSVAMIPIFAVYQLWLSYRHPNYDGLSLGKRLIKLTQPTEEWRPSYLKHTPVKPNSSSDDHHRPDILTDLKCRTKIHPNPSDLDAVDRRDDVIDRSIGFENAAFGSKDVETSTF